MKDNPKIKYASIHQDGIFPYGRGKRTERGNYQNILSVPLPAGTSGDSYLKIFRQEVIPFIKDFHPQLVIVCAGYDALQSDELAEVRFHCFWTLSYPHLLFVAVSSSFRLLPYCSLSAREFRREYIVRVRDRVPSLTRVSYSAGLLGWREAIV